MSPVPAFRRRPARAAAFLLPLLLGAGAARAQQPAPHDAAHDPAAHELYFGAVLFEKLEWGVGLNGAPNVARWDGQAWYGNDYDKVWAKTQGEAERGRRAEHAEVQLLYSRLVGYYWNLQAGLRYDVRPRPDRAYGVIGVQGLAPGLFEVDAQGFVSERGDLSARLTLFYDLLITQRLVLQPNVEINVAARTRRGNRARRGPERRRGRPAAALRDHP